MGLISNIQDKISHNKDPNVNASYNQNNNPLPSNAPTHGSSGITGGSHPLVSGNNNATTGYGSGEGSHLAGSTGQYSDTGVTGSQHTGSGHGVTGNTHHTGTGAAHVGEDNRGLMDKAKDALSSKRSNQPDDPITGTNYDQKDRDHTSTSGSGLTGGVTHGTSSHHNTHSGSQANQAVDFVPGSHPAANNASAIPTAGGQKLGGVGEGVGHSGSHAGVHETAGDKIKNTLPGQHGNAHDAYGNPINPSTTGPHTSSSHTTGTHHPGGLTGSNTTHTNAPGSGFSSSAQPLSHDSNFNERHSGTGVGSGLTAGAVGGAGLAGAGHHTTGTHNSSGLTGSNTHSTTHGSNYPVEDNRGLIDKAKDTLSSKRSNQPDDPITGTNYDQTNRDEHTSATHGTHGSGLTAGSSHNTHSSRTHQPGITGIAHGVDQAHLGSNTHSSTHSSSLSHGSHSGRSAEWQEGYQAGYREASLSLSSGSHSNTGVHSGSHIPGSHSSTTTGTAHRNTGYDNTKPTIGDKLNPKTDADRDGKVGIMD